MSDLELIKKYLDKDKWDNALNLLNEGYPVQYIIGNVEFFGNIIDVNENVLIPRFETEYLVEKTINYINKLNFKKKINVLEIGTGSGCISISLKKNLNCEITAIDISDKAIKVANNNAVLNNIKIDFEVLDIHNFKSNDKYNLIISNPPYIPNDSYVDPKTKYEPQNALFADDEGLYFYKIILEKIKNNLEEEYLIAFEIGDKQGHLVKEIAKNHLSNCFVKIEKDYNNYERYVFITNKKEIFN